jgi:hypothetical protein
MKPNQKVLDRFEKLMKMGRDIDSSRRATDFGTVIDNEMFYQWATSSLDTIQQVFGKDSAHYMYFQEFVNEFGGWADQFQNCRGILKAAKEDYENGFDSKARSLIVAEILNAFLTQSSKLLSEGNKDVACVIAGLVLETAIGEISDQQGITSKNIRVLNRTLRHAEVYNAALEEQIELWSTNLDNAKKNSDNRYTVSDIEDMIQGIKNVLSSLL